MIAAYVCCNMYTIAKPTQGKALLLPFVLLALFGAGRNCITISLPLLRRLCIVRPGYAVNLRWLARCNGPSRFVKVGFLRYGVPGKSSSLSSTHRLVGIRKRDNYQLTSQARGRSRLPAVADVAARQNPARLHPALLTVHARREQKNATLMVTQQVVGLPTPFLEALPNALRACG